MALLQTSFTLCELHEYTLGDIGMRGSNLISESDVSRWAKEFLRLAAQQTHWYRTSLVTGTTADTQEYDLPAGCLAVEDIYHLDLPLEAMTHSDLMRFDPWWQTTASGTPYAYYVRGATAYGLYPKPSATDADAVTLFYTAIPAMPATPNDTLPFPTANELAIRAYCLWRASLKDASGEGARRVQVYEQEWKAELQRLKESVSDFHQRELIVVGGHRTRGGDWRDVIERSSIPAPE